MMVALYSEKLTFPMPRRDMLYWRIVRVMVRATVPLTFRTMVTRFSAAPLKGSIWE